VVLDVALYNLRSQMADSLGAFVPVCIRVAVAGFTSSAWHVRNSSVMLYSAGIERAVGYNNRNADVADRSAGITSTQFFSRFPQLHVLLLSGLRFCIAEALRSEGAHWFLDPSHGLRVVLSPGFTPFHHPSLHPLLLLLSRLRPDSTAPIAQPLLSVEQFLPLIRVAACQRHMHVRRMAARALAALLPDDELPFMVRSICSDIANAVLLDKSWRRASIESASVSEECTSAPLDDDALFNPGVLLAAAAPRSWDTLHGSLLQLNALLSRYLEKHETSELNQRPPALLLDIDPESITALHLLASESSRDVPSVVVGEASLASSMILGVRARQADKQSVSPNLLGGCLCSNEEGCREVATAMSALKSMCRPSPLSTIEAAAALSWISRITAAILSTNEDLACSAAVQLAAQVKPDLSESLWELIIATRHEIDAAAIKALDGWTATQCLLKPLVLLLERPECSS